MDLDGAFDDLPDLLLVMLLAEIRKSPFPEYVEYKNAILAEIKKRTEGVLLIEKGA